MVRKDLRPRYWCNRSILYQVVVQHKDGPSQLQVSSPDAYFKIFVKRRAEKYELSFLIISEETFRCLIKASCYVIKGIRRAVFRVLQFF